MKNKNEVKTEECLLLSKTIFSTTNILSVIKKYLIPEEKILLFSCNKFLNQYFRNSITQLPAKIIVNNPSIIKRFPNIDKIKIEFGWELDLSFIKNIKNLECIDIEGDGYKNIEIIGEMENVNELILIGNKLTNIDFINNKLDKLNLLDIGNNYISDLSPLNNLKNLKSLSLQGCCISNLDILILNLITNLILLIP